MTLTKNTIVDKCETVKIQDYYILQVRERNQILEDGQEISSSFHRYILNPDADTSTISDPVVLAQFNAVMTDTVKQNYQAFLASQTEEHE
tara:strand:- start:459 stop:728 length:270 start_codon:yes stop_codon:yes gene_type:complete